MLQVFNKRFKLRESCNANQQNIEFDQKSGKITQNKSSAKIPINFPFATKASNFIFNLHESYNAYEHDKDCDQKGDKIRPTKPVSNIGMNFSFVTKTSDSTYMKATMQISMTNTVTRKATKLNPQNLFQTYK